MECHGRAVKNARSKKTSDFSQLEAFLEARWGESSAKMALPKLL
jgi:hypothetical protein